MLKIEKKIELFFFNFRFMADTVPAQVVPTSIIASAKSPKLIVQTGYSYPVRTVVDRKDWIGHP